MNLCGIFYTSLGLGEDTPLNLEQEIIKPKIVEVGLLDDLLSSFSIFLSKAMEYVQLFIENIKTLQYKEEIMNTIKFSLEIAFSIYLILLLRRERQYIRRMESTFEQREDKLLKEIKELKALIEKQNKQ